MGKQIIDCIVILNNWMDQQKKRPNNKQVNEACMYFSTGLALPIKETILQQHLNTLQNTKAEILSQCSIQNLLIERYYQIVKDYAQFKIQQSLMVRLLALMSRLIVISDNGEQELVVLIWGCVSHLKKCVPQTENKLLIKQVLELISIVLQKLLQIQKFKAESIYPQLSATLMHFIINSHQVNHIIFGKSLAIMSRLIIKIFQQREPESSINRIEPTKQNQRSFETECLTRLQSYLKIMIDKVPKLELVYHHSISQFVGQLWQIGQKYLILICPLAILGQLSDTKIDYLVLPHSLQKLIQSSITTQFITILSTHNTNILQRGNNLKKLQKLSSLISPSPEQSTLILQKFTNYLYLIENRKSLIVPHITVAQSTHLIEIAGVHSFSNYPVGLEGLLQSFQFECERILLAKMPYAETSLSNISSLKKIANSLPATANLLISQLVEKISQQQGQYMVDMSLTKFCQFLTKIVLLYWLVSKPNYKLPPEIALNIFQVLSNCQAIRILQPSFEQQQILIGFTLLICYQCYNSLGEASNMNAIKKLKFKLAMLQMVVNNVYEQSFIVRCACYYILLAESAPNTISEHFQNLQTTLINRNYSNLHFIIALLKLCELSSNQCEDLAHKFMQYAGSEQLLRNLLPRLKTQTIRKCLLSATSSRGKWIHLLKSNTKLLYQRKIEEGEQLKAKVGNFYMADGPNVQISNALGVILLELGPNWEYALANQSQYKDLALDLLLELVHLDTSMVFFKNRFTGVLKCLTQILSDQEQNKNDMTHASERRRYKIYKILSGIPGPNYSFYKQHLLQTTLALKKSKPQVSQVDLLQTLLANVQSKHKKYQLSYLMNSNNREICEIYDCSDDIINKLSEALVAKEHDQTQAQTNT